MPGCSASGRRVLPACPFDPAAGASPLFPPRHAESESARQELLFLVRRDPHECGRHTTRWTLAEVRAVCDWLRQSTLPGIHQILDRLGIHLKRGRDYVHSPDPDYLGKLAEVRLCVERVRTHPGLEVLLFQDELTYYRQPTVARDYAQSGAGQPLARRSYHSNTARRIVASLDALTGRVLYQQRSHVTLEGLVDFYAYLCACYPQAETIYLVQDNWPIHFHPDVLAALQPQTFRWPRHVAKHWRIKARRKARRLNLPIQILPLPTYASWTNPIEKLWRWLKQDALHLHRLADQWDALQEMVDGFLAHFAEGSRALLRYVGLQDLTKLYQQAFPIPAPMIVT
jgi:hypothetical protein